MYKDLNLIFNFKCRFRDFQIWNVYDTHAKFKYTESTPSHQHWDGHNPSRKNQPAKNFKFC